MHYAVALGIVGQHGLLLVALLAHGLLGVGQVVFLFLRYLLGLLLALALVYGGEPGLLSFQFADYGLQRLGGGVVAVGQHLLDERVVAVEHHAVAVGHLCIESHARLEAADVLHSPHVFALGYYHGLCLLTHGLHLDIDLGLVELWQLAAEHR